MNKKKMNIKVKKGALHKELGVKSGKKLTAAQLEVAKKRAKKTGNTKLERRVVFAENAKKWKHKGRKKS